MVRDRDLEVLELALVLEHVGDVGGHVQDVLDAVLAQLGQVGRVLGAAQIEVGQNLDRERAGDGTGGAAAVVGVGRARG